MPEPLTPERIAALWDLCADTTPGPWYLVGDPRTEVASDNDGDPVVIADTRFFQEQTNASEIADAAFIAAAREAVPDLLGALAASQATVAELREQVRKHCIHVSSISDSLSWCGLCLDYPRIGLWRPGSPEQHAPGCLAAQPPEREA